MGTLELEPTNYVPVNKPRIGKGFYAGRFISVKPLTNKEGMLVENKFGPQWILEFDVYRRKALNEDETEFTIGKAMTYKDGNVEADCILPVFLNSHYKVTDKQQNVILDKEGKVQYRSALSQKSRLGKVFTALGWPGPPTKLRPEELIGTFVELTVDDYTPPARDGKEQPVQSSIKDVQPWKGQVPADMPPVTRKENAHSGKTISHEEMEEELSVEEETAGASEYDEKVQGLQEKLDNGEITRKGFDMAVEQLKTIHRRG